MSRRFHLSEARTEQSASRLSVPGAIQRKRPYLATFEEERDGLARKLKKPRSIKDFRGSDQSALVNTNNKPTVEGQIQDVKVDTAPRKRPKASEAEKKWRAQTWTNDRQTEDLEGPSATSICSPSLAEQLREMAMEEHHKFISKERPTTNQAPKLKHQPKSPPPRIKAREELVASDSDDEMLDAATDEEDYVIETYIRQPKDLLTGMDGETLKSDGGLLGVGYLVISPEQEELWETFLEDEEKEGDWDSEDEDSNAEDNPSNDYPEEEVESDDEYGQGAYNYRNAASDDEQFGDEYEDENDDNAWSDDEKLSAGAVWLQRPSQYRRSSNAATLGT